jgi:hypothetical protein
MQARYCRALTNPFPFFLKGKTMRSYPRNSPEAAARIVALVLIWTAMFAARNSENQLDRVHHLGLSHKRCQTIVQTLCEDLLMEGFDGRSILSHVGEGLMASLMAEVDQPRLKRDVLHIAERR